MVEKRKDLIESQCQLLHNFIVSPARQGLNYAVAAVALHLTPIYQHCLPILTSGLCIYSAS